MHIPPLEPSINLTHNTSLKEIFEVIEIVVKSTAIILGGIWIYFKFIINRENYPKIQFEVDLRFIDRQDNKIVLEVVAILNNRGQVRHTIDNFLLDIYVLERFDKIMNGDKKINFQVKMNKFNPERDATETGGKFSDRIVWIRDDWKNTFIDPNVEHKFTYLTWVPKDTTLVCIYSRFETKRKDFQFAQRAFSIKNLEGKKMNNQKP